MKFMLLNKVRVITAQTVVQAKNGAGAHANCQVNLLPSSSTGTLASNLVSGRPLVLGLPAASFPLTGAKHSQVDNEGAHNKAGSELKKRKCVMALQNGESSFAVDGVVGNNVIGTNVSVGGGF